MKFAVLYERRGKLIIGAQGRTTAGVLIGLQQPESTDADVDALTLGRMLRGALSRSTSPIPHPQPTQWPAIMQTFLDGARMKTWGSFVRGADLTTVESDGTTISFQPHENLGAREGFQPRGLPAVVVSATVTDEELGKAAQKALAIAQSREPHKT
jgi:hypothetical protein